ncbi:MAG: transporter substrate-binding domain-containing protein, partial [Bacilli bacterium]|nr:transporter substrate-binding domain-containing protein [Bacilli bacterium]
MKKLIYLSLCGFIILLFGFTTVHADAGEERTIYLSATEYDYPPFSVTDNGKADGFSVELLKAVAKEMGITVSFKIDQWSILKEELKNGELDILPLVGYTLERDEIYDFTVPYIVMRGNIFVRKGETEILSQDDLYGKEVLVLDGDNSQEWAWSIGLDEELTATSTYTEAFLLLESGQYDAVLAQGLVGEKIISDEGIANIEPVYIYDNDGLTKIKLNLEGYEQKFCFAVVEGDSELLSILNEGLVIVSANGTYDELFQKWFPFYIETTPVSLQEVLLYVSVILIPILTVMFVLYVITVRRSVRIKTEQIEKNNFANQIIANAFQHKFSSAFERFDYIL